MKVAILYYRLLSDDGADQLIGGIETYLVNLGNLCAEMGLEPILFQTARRSFEKKLGSICIVGVPDAGSTTEKQRLSLFSAAMERINPAKDIIIFGADHCSSPTENKRCVSIQHGVSWDLPTRFSTRKKFFMTGPGATLKKKLARKRAIADFNNCFNRVCVDYNFLNWYRAQIAEEPQGKIWVIPNFASDLVDREKVTHERSQKPTVDVIFARRFTSYRGARLMVEAAKQLLPCYPNLRVTLAGEGPEEVWMRQQLSSDERVRFIKYLPNDALATHAAHDIAVIPSIGSEGTSFSVAEAMGAGCAVVASNVGGMTNMIIDGYNGLLVSPEKASLTTAIRRLLEDQELRVKLGERALDTAAAAFNKPRWKAEWRAVLEELARA